MSTVNKDQMPLATEGCAAAAGYVVGQRVIAARTIDEGPSEDGPGQLFCRKGEELIVREITTFKHWPIYVSHDGRTDCSFGVEAADLLPHTS